MPAPGTRPRPGDRPRAGARPFRGRQLRTLTQCSPASRWWAGGRAGRLKDGGAPRRHLDVGADGASAHSGGVSSPRRLVSTAGRARTPRSPVVAGVLPGPASPVTRPPPGEWRVRDPCRLPVDRRRQAKARPFGAADLVSPIWPPRATTSRPRRRVREAAPLEARPPCRRPGAGPTPSGVRDRGWNRVSSFHRAGANPPVFRAFQERGGTNSNPMRCFVCGTITVALVAGLCTATRAQSRSRADVQVGAVLLHTAPGVVIGGTGWIGERAGVASRGYFVPGLPRVLEIGLRSRGFVRGSGEDVEVDFGLSLMALKTEESVPARRRMRSAEGWHQYLMMDVLLGRRLAERFGLKVGAGLAFYGRDAGLGFSVKFLAVVPLGSR